MIKPFMIYNDTISCHIIKCCYLMRLNIILATCFCILFAICNMYGVTVKNSATTERHMQYIWCHNNQLSLIIKSHKLSTNFEFKKKKMCHILNINKVGK